MKILLLLVLIFFSSLAFSQTTWTWNSKNGPYGANVNSIAVTSGGTYFIATNTGVFSSTDGATWTKANVTTNQNSFVGVAVSSSGTIYALQNFVNPGFSGLFSSTDGISWNLLSNNLPSSSYSKIKVAPNGTIYISSSGSTSIYRSTNNGGTFGLIIGSVPSGVNDIAIDGNNNLIVATQSNGVIVSADGGTTFPNSGIALTAVYSLAVDGSNNLFALASTGPYISKNSGSTWASNKGLIADVTFNGLINTDGSGNLYLFNSSSSKLYVSSSPTAASPAWATGVNYNASNSNVINCAYFKNSTFALLGRYGTGIDLSTNGGSTWSSSSTGIKGLNSPRIIQTTPNNRLFCAAGMNGYFVSIDDGSNWNLINSGNANTLLYGFVTLSDGSILGYGASGAIRTTNEGTAWTVQNSTTFINNVVTSDGVKLYFPSSSTDVSVSSNQGVTWTAKGLTGIGSNSIQTIIAPDNGGNLYLKVLNTSSQYEVWKVNNGSTTAAKLSGYPGTAVISDIKVLGANVYVASFNTLSKSVDGGTTWTAVNLPPSPTNISKIYLYDDSNIIIQTNAGVYSSTDGGSSWLLKQLQDGPSATLSDLFFAPDQSVYAATNKSVVQKSSTPAILPVAPTGLAITAKSVESVDLVFNDNSSNETAYLLEASIGNNFSYQQVSSFTGPGSFNGPQGVVALNYINSGVSADSVNLTYFRVRATNLAGNSSYSNEVSGNGLKNCTSTIPDNRSWSAVATADPGSTASTGGPFTNATITIQKVPNTKNNFLVSLYALGVTPTSIHPTSATATFVETCGTTYFQFDNDPNFGFQDVANGNGTWNGTNTLVLKWQTDPNWYSKFQGTTTFTLNSTDPVPAVPTISAFVFSSSSVGLIWSSTSFAKQYIIERSTTSGTFSGPPLATLNYPTIQYTDSGLTPGVTYYYRITAKNTTGSSTPSTQTSITPPVNTLFTPLQNNMSLNTDSQQGVSWGDLDGDGDEDYISPSFTNSAGQVSVPVFYENIGGGQFNRRNLAILLNENIATYRGANVIDMNNDGKLDIYFTRSVANSIPDLVLINNGGWNFTKSNINQTARVNGSGFRASSFADYDRDGLIDLFVADTDPDPNAQNLSPVTPSFLLRNITSGGNISFNQINSGSIVTNSVECRDVSWADFNNDGLQDLLVTSFNLNATNPTPNIPNRIYKNNGDGTFTQLSVFDADVFFRARTSSWGDIDNDGDLDLYIGSQVATVADRLYQNNGNGTFTSLTSSAVAETGTTTYGSAFGDIDNDGDLDLIAINMGQSNSIFINDGTGNFTKSTSNELLSFSGLNNIGGSFVDYDQNGFLDISTGRNGGNIPPYLFQNTLGAAANRNWIEVKLVGTVSNVAAIGARVTVTTTSPTKTQIREVSARTGYGSQNSLIQHFGLGSASSISQIQIKWPNGGIQTLTNPSINQLITIPEDLTGPTFSNLSPANASSNATVNTTLSFTLNEAGAPVAGKNINVFLTSNTVTPVFSIAVTSGSMSNNTYTYNLPQALIATTGYSVSIDAGAFADVYGNASLALPFSSWQFTTADLVAPQVSFTQVTTLPKANLSTSKFTVTASDNVSVASVVMSYRKITFTQFQTLSVTVASSLNTYDFPLQASYFDDMGIEYFFTAKDPAGNSTTIPATGTYTTHLTFDGTAQESVGVSAGSQKSDYVVISVPLDLTSANISNIFSDFGGPDVTSWRLLRYQDSPQAWIDYNTSGFTSVARGEGYFVLSKTGRNLAFQGATSPNYSQSNLFLLNLKKGFNLIGNPYTVPINWEDSKVANVNSVQVFQGGNYVGGTTIQPFGGGFVYADADVQVAVKMQINPGEPKKNNGNSGARDAQKWIVPIKMIQATHQFNFGGVGMASNASYSYDEFDDFAPPSPFGIFEMKFPHPEHFMKNFAKDVVPVSAGFSWNFSVGTELEGDVALTWDSSEANADLYLFDIAQQRPINMRGQSSYVIDPKSSKNFTIYYGTDVQEKLKPQMIFLGQASPNPSSGVTNITFNLPENSSPFNVKVDVYDLMGNRITTLLDEQLNSGFYSTSWNATTSNASSGLYVYRLQVNWNGLQKTLSGKVILNR